MQYVEDPLVYHGGIPARTALSFLGAISWANDNEHLLRVPLLVVHGEHDALCNVRGSQQLLERAQSDDKQLHIIPDAWHEVLWLESVRHEIRDWLLARTRRQTP